MRVFMGEYGRTILVALVGVFALGMGCLFLMERLHIFYPETKGRGLEGVENTGDNLPVLLVPNNLKIKKGDKNYDAKSHQSEPGKQEYLRVKQNYLKMVQAYEDASCQETSASLAVYGINDVNVEKIGSYILIYQVKDKEGQVFQRKTKVIVN